MPRTPNKMMLISVHLPRHMIQEIDELVKAGVYPSRSEVIRIAVRDLLIRESNRLNGGIQ